MTFDKRSQLRIFHFILDHRVGGPHVYVRSLAKVMAGKAESTLVTTGRGEATQLSLVNLRHRLKVFYPLEIAINCIKLMWMFRRRSTRLGCIFNVHGAANIAPIIAARLLGVPLVWHFHETLGGFCALVRFGRRFMYGVPHAAVVVARRAALTYCLDDAELIPAPVDPAFWKKPGGIASPRSEEAELRMLVVGNLNPLKGFDILLEALKDFRRPCRLTIVGSELATFAGYADSLRNGATMLRAMGMVIEFAGWKSQEELRGLLAEADVFVLPSRSEACPIALLEAMAMECACIATDVGDVRDMLGDAGCGYVVRPESADCLREAFEGVVRIGAQGRSDMGARARARVVECYSPALIAERHLRVYAKLRPEYFTNTGAEQN